MIQRIASILKDRIAAFSYVDKAGGLIRVARQQREGREIVIPVAGDVDAAYACDPATIRDMVPDERYGCIVYFEDRGTTSETSRTRGTFYSASIRLVCWVNTLKFGSDPNAADRILEQFTHELNVGQPYNTDTLIGLKHRVDGIPQRGATIFSQYTYPEAARQYLLWPFDAFALDITVSYRVRPGCEEAPTPDDDACWTPPTTKKRRNPSEFTCEELTDPVTGLTPAQLGPDCLDCEGGGPCDPTTVNGTEITGIAVTVTQGGVEVGTVNPATGEVVVDECPECDPLTITLGGVEIVNEADPCGVDVELTCADTVDAVLVEVAVEAQKVGLYTASAIVNGRTSYENAPNHVIEWTGTQYQLRDLFTGPDWITTNAPATPWAGTWVNVSDGNPIDGSVAQGTIADICRTPCDPLTVTVNDAIEFTTVADPCGGTVNVPVVNEADEEVGTLVDGQIVVPTAKSLCQLVTEGTAEEVAICVTSSGKRAGVLAELIPTVDPSEVVAQVYDAMTSDQQNELAANVTVNGTAFDTVLPTGTIDVPVVSEGDDPLGTVVPGVGVVIENATVQLVDSNDNPIGAPVVVAPESTDTTIQTPQSVIKYKDAADASQVTAAADTEFAGSTLRAATEVPRRELTLNGSGTGSYVTLADLIAGTVPDVTGGGSLFTKFIWQAGDADTYLWTVTADEAGSYGTYTQTGTNGTLTYSLNGGGYAALSGSIVLAVGDTITVRRTTTTNAGTVRWAP